MNTSINSIKCIDKDTPLQPVKNRKIKASLTNNKLLNDNYNTQMNNNNRCNIFETKRRLRTSRPKSEKKISPRKQSLSNNKISDSNKDENNQEDKKEEENPILKKNISELIEKPPKEISKEIQTEIKNLKNLQSTYKTKINNEINYLLIKFLKKLYLIENINIFFIIYL